MLILAFDTAGPALSVALCRDASVLSALHIPLARGHAERLLPAIEGVVRAAGLKLAEVDAIATTVGPGSFTGLRTGLAAAQGLAFALDTPLVGIGRFEAFAEAAGVFGRSAVVVAMDSKARTLYVQALGRDGRPAEGWPEAGLNRAGDGFGDVSWPEGGLLVGDGAAVLADHGAPLLQVPCTQVSAPAVAACARRALAAGHTGLPAEPLYLAPPRAIPPKDGGRLRAR